MLANFQVRLPVGTEHRGPRNVPEDSMGIQPPTCRRWEVLGQRPPGFLNSRWSRKQRRKGCRGQGRKLQIWKKQANKYYLESTNGKETRMRWPFGNTWYLVMLRNFKLGRWDDSIVVILFKCLFFRDSYLTVQGVLVPFFRRWGIGLQWIATSSEHIMGWTSTLSQG